MLGTLKKTAAVWISSLLLFCACSSDNSPETPSGGKENITTITGANVESAIFDRDIDYNGFAPADGIALPIDSKDILDVVQIEKVLYLLSGDGVYTLNIESGESGKLIDIEHEQQAANALIASDGENILLYFPHINKIEGYDTGGALIDELTPGGMNGWEIKDFEVTDDYYVFLCFSGGDGMNADMQYAAIDKESSESAATVKARSGTEAIYRYYENSILFTAENNANPDTGYDLYYLDIENEETGYIRALSGIGQNCLYDLIYNPQTDTVLAFGDMFSTSELSAYGTPAISEFSVTDDDNVTCKRFSLETGSDDSCFISVYENIASIITTADSEFRYFDFLNPPKSITIVYNEATKGRLADVILAFESESGILVRTTDYGSNMELIDLKLMAGDSDFDLFCPVNYNIFKYVSLGIFDELNSYKDLTARLNTSSLASVVSAYNGKYFGVPTYAAYLYPRELYPEGDSFAFSRIASLCQYCAENIDAVAGTYDDEDGDELYELLRFLYDNPTGNEDEMPYGDEFIDGSGELCCLTSSYVMLNPASQNKDTAVKFMEYIFDAYSGKIDGVIPESSQYMQLESTDSYFASWQHMPSDVLEPLMEAYHSVAATDGSSGEIKKLARDTASEIKMRLME